MRNYVLDHILGNKTKGRSRNAVEHSKRDESTSIHNVPSLVAKEIEVTLPPVAAAIKKKRKKKKNNFPTPEISDFVPDDIKVSWLVDTGSPFDLIGRDELTDAFIGERVRKIMGQALLTANGEIVAREVVDIAVKELRETASPLLLDSTPAVLSVGLRCMELGYSFHWPKNQNPYFITPTGHRLKLRVDQNVPYLCPCKAPACVCTVGSVGISAPTEAKPPPVVSKVQPAQASSSSKGPSIVSPELDGEIVEAVAEPPIPLVGGRRDRRLEASSVEHLMTHSPKNKHCPACQRAKMQTKPARQVEGSELGEPVAFGDQTTGDHLITQNELDQGLEGQETAVVLKDRFSGWRDCYPKASKSADDAYAALLDFQGPKDSVKYFYSDSSPELAKAATDLGWCHGTATPGRKESNGVAEAAVKAVLQGARSILERAGFKPAWWPAAVKHWCFAANTAIVDGESPWQLRHGKGHFSGLMLPFGCLVDFKPSAVKPGRRARRVPHPKFAPIAEPGVFMGYHVLPGGRWRGDFLVASLQEFNTAIANPGRSGKHKIRIQRVKELYRNTQEAVTFPLKEHYDRDQRTIHSAAPDPVFEPVLVIDQDPEPELAAAPDGLVIQSDAAATDRTPEEQRVIDALRAQKQQDLPASERVAKVPAPVSGSGIDATTSGLIATTEVPIAQGG